MAEKSLAFCRLKLKGSEAMTLNQRIHIGKDASKRTDVAAIIGTMDVVFGEIDR